MQKFLVVSAPEKVEAPIIYWFLSAYYIVENKVVSPGTILFQKTGTPESAKIASSLKPPSLIK